MRLGAAIKAWSSVEWLFSWIGDLQGTATSENEAGEIGKLFYITSHIYI